MAAFGVVVTEVMNTAVEHVVDLASPDWSPLAEKAKDASAGAVLLASVMALLVGALVLGPKCLELIGR
jgi:diacylglycerol kinase